ncbi:MAG: hypothetical protein M1837_000551 [Sclerophora amabilis]|nr:MAG: hypothetical protein M1837_000551 [Sclerophora amabilis]
MAEDASATEEKPITFNVKSSNEAKYALTLPKSTTILDLKNKLAGSDYADIAADRQRLIYSGRVLKDADTLGSHKIQDGHTIHLVRSASSNQRQNPSSSSTGASTVPGSGGAGGDRGGTGVPTNLASGTGNNPLAGLTGARYAGLAQLPGAGMFGPDGGMGAPPDPEQLASQLSNPQFVSTLNEALQNPQVLDMMIQQNPMLRDMGPAARQMLQSPEFRRMMTDPEYIRSMAQMSRTMGMGPFGGMGNQGGGGGGSFPAPGVTDTTPASAPEGTATGGGTTRTPGQTDTTGSPPPPPNPFAMFGGPGAGGAGAGPGAAGNPFAALFANQGTPNPAAPSEGGENPEQQQQQQLPPNPFASFLNNPNNPLLQNPQAMQQMLGAMMGGGGGGGGAGDFNPFAAFGGAPGAGAGAGAGGSPAPPDNRPPEERYADQLGQLNDMGFYDFDTNVAALRRSGGSVQGAVEYLLSQ